MKRRRNEKKKSKQMKKLRDVITFSSEQEQF